MSISDQQMQNYLENRKGERYCFKSMTMRQINEEDFTLEAVINARVVDRDSEVILPKGAKLENYLKNPVVLWAHDHDQPPIGKMIKHKITEDEFVAKDQFAVKEYPFAGTIFNLYKSGMLSAFSIGFIPLATSEADEDKLDGQKGDTVTKWEMLEHSSVLIPALPVALVTMAKYYKDFKQGWDKAFIKDLEALIEYKDTKYECGHFYVYNPEKNDAYEFCPLCANMKLSAYEKFVEGTHFKMIMVDGELIVHDCETDEMMTAKEVRQKFIKMKRGNINRIVSLEQDMSDVKKRLDTMKNLEYNDSGESLDGGFLLGKELFPVYNEITKETEMMRL